MERQQTAHLDQGEDDVDNRNEICETPNSEFITSGPSNSQYRQTEQTNIVSSVGGNKKKGSNHNKPTETSSYQRNNSESELAHLREVNRVSKARCRKRKLDRIKTLNENVNHLLAEQLSLQTENGNLRQEFLECLRTSSPQQGQGSASASDTDQLNYEHITDEHISGQDPTTAQQILPFPLDGALSLIQQGIVNPELLATVMFTNNMTETNDTSNDNSRSIGVGNVDDIHQEQRQDGEVSITSDNRKNCDDYL